MFNEKQKKPFVSLSVISHTIPVIYYFSASLAQAIEALYEANVNLFYRDTGSKQGQPIFFPFFICFSAYFKNQNIYLKKTGSQSC